MNNIGFSSLPNVIHCQIFSLLPPETLIRCRAVSKKWKELIERPQSWPVFLEFCNSYNIDKKEIKIDKFIIGRKTIFCDLLSKQKELNNTKINIKFLENQKKEIKNLQKEALSDLYEVSAMIELFLLTKNFLNKTIKMQKSGVFECVFPYTKQEAIFSIKWIKNQEPIDEISKEIYFFIPNTPAPNLYLIAASSYLYTYKRRGLFKKYYCDYTLAIDFKYPLPKELYDGSTIKNNMRDEKVKIIQNLFCHSISSYIESDNKGFSDWFGSFNKVGFVSRLDK